MNTVENGVLNDFPAGQLPGAVSGVQPKVLLASSDSRYYSLGSGSAARYKAWCHSKQLTKWFIREHKRERKTSAAPDEAILRTLYGSAARAADLTDEQLYWAVKRAADAIGCRAPVMKCKLWLPRAYEVDDAAVEALFGSPLQTSSWEARTELQEILAPLLRKNS